MNISGSLNISNQGLRSFEHTGSISHDLDQVQEPSWIHVMTSQYINSSPTTVSTSWSFFLHATYTMTVFSEKNANNLTRPPQQRTWVQQQLAKLFPLSKPRPFASGAWSLSRHAMWKGGAQAPSQISQTYLDISKEEFNIYAHYLQRHPLDHVLSCTRWDFGASPSQ